MGVALMSRPNENGPEVTTPQGRPDASLATKTDNTDRISRRRYVPRAFASIYAPDARRRRWLVVYICPRCKFGHRALADSEQEAEGLRPRGACGRRVVITVARTYRGRVAA